MTRLLRILPLALVHTVLFNGIYYINHFGNDAVRDIARALSIAGFDGILLFFLLGLHRTILLFTAPLIFLIDGLIGYFIHYYKIDVRADTLALFFETNYEEASAFLDGALFIWAFAASSFGVFLTCFAVRNYPSTSRRTLWTLIGLGGISFGLNHLDRSNNTPDPLPEVIYYQTKSYWKEHYKLESLFMGRKNLADVPFSAPQDDLTVVFVIGESARSDHFGLNGYARDTTPRLSQLDVVAFRDVISCGNVTRISVPCLMGRGGLEDPKAYLKETSFISLFRKAGFATTWISNQRVLHRNDTFITGIAHEAARVVFNYKSYHRARDADMLSEVKNILNANNPKQLLIFHTIGNHWPYNERYGEEYARFSPICRRQNPKFCSEDELINAYDNAILATDSLLADIIDLLINRKAILIYTSDHGESLGEGGIYNHGQGNGAGSLMEQRKVPIFIWLSPPFRASRPEIYKSLLQKTKTGETLTHAYIFHSILDCSGFEGSVIDQRLSLCRER